MSAAARPLIMGVVNATPDSFSDAGRFPDPVARGMELLEQGADLLVVLHRGEHRRRRRGAAPAVQLGVRH